MHNIHTSLKIRLGFLLALVICCTDINTAQEVSISEELNIRNYFAYEILGKIDQRYLVFRDKGIIKEMDVFNEYMEHTQHSELFFEKKKTDVFHAMSVDSTVQLVYNYFHKDSVYVKWRRYNNRVELKDSMTLAVIHKDRYKKRFSPILSEDKSKLLFYTQDRQDNLYVTTFDNKLKKVTRQFKISIPEYNSKKDLLEIILTNKGEIICTLMADNAYTELYNVIGIVDFGSSGKNYVYKEVWLEDAFRLDTHVVYDNLNEKLTIVGLYTVKRGKDTEGYFWLSTPIKSLNEGSRFKYMSFANKLAEDIKKNKRKKNKLFENFQVQQIVKRNDGGVILVLELIKEFSRRSVYNSYDRKNYAGVDNRGWVDYCNEDLILLNIAPDGKADWSKILYKKQFSQDDEAIYSSYFAMKTPSRLRMIYNDEIKKSNTVSAYMIDPNGKIARNSLLSTEYQDMKLRFRDAVQVSSTELLVPSENNYELNLVKIKF